MCPLTALVLCHHLELSTGSNLFELGFIFDIYQTQVIRNVEFSLFVFISYTDTSRHILKVL